MTKTIVNDLLRFIVGYGAQLIYLIGEERPKRTYASGRRGI